MLYEVDEVTQAPLVSKDTVLALLKKVYGIQKADLTDLTGYEDNNIFVRDIVWDGESAEKETEAVLKITNPIESRLEGHIDFQIEICEILRGRGIPAVQLIKRRDGKLWGYEDVKEGVTLPIRLFRVLPGRMMEEFPFTSQLVSQLGETMGEVHNAMDAFRSKPVTHIPFISPLNSECILREVDVLVSSGILSCERAQTVREVLEEVREIVTHTDKDDYGLIHSDLNETNVLMMEKGEQYQVTGVLDFGDMHLSPRVFDVAAAILYLELSDKQEQGFQKVTENFLEGYTRKRSFTAHNQLLPAMRARLSCSLVYGLRTARINYRGGSTEYVLKTQSNGWKVLEELCKMEHLQ